MEKNSSGTPVESAILVSLLQTSGTSKTTAKQNFKVNTNVIEWKAPRVLYTRDHHLERSQSYSSCGLILHIYLSTHSAHVDTPINSHRLK